MPPRIWFRMPSLTLPRTTSLGTILIYPKDFRLQANLQAGVGQPAGWQAELQVLNERAMKTGAFVPPGGVVMVNQLGKKTVNAIRRLHAEGWSYRRIARTLSVHPETVGRYVSLDEAKLAGVRSEPHNLCLPYREAILAKLERGLSARRIHRDLVDEEGFKGSYSSVREFVRHLRSGPKRLYFREYYRLTRGNMGRWYLAEIFKDRDTADLDTIVREVRRVAGVNFTRSRIERSLNDHVTHNRDPPIVEYKPRHYKHQGDADQPPNRPLLFVLPGLVGLIWNLAGSVLCILRRRSSSRSA